MDPINPTAMSKPASEEIFGRKFCEKPCRAKFCPQPRECWESMRNYVPAYYKPWKCCACPAVKITMLDEKSPVPYGWPNYSGQMCNKLTNLRMTDAYTRRPPDRAVYCVSKYKTDYCRPLEVHILPHCPRCEGPHVCAEPMKPRDACAPIVQHRSPIFRWHDGFASLNYAESSFPSNPVLSQAQRCKHPCDDLWDLPCLRQSRLPLPPVVKPCKPLPGGDCSVLIEHQPYNPCSAFFGGPGERTKRANRLRREAFGRMVLADARQNPFPCGVPTAKKMWGTWSSVRGVYCPKRPNYNPVCHRAGVKSGLTLGEPYKKTLDF